MNIEAELQKALKHNSLEKVNNIFEKIYCGLFKLGMFVALQYLDENNAIEIVDDIFVSFFEKIINEKRCEIQNIKQYICVSIKNASLKRIKEQKKMIPYNDDIDYQKNDGPIYSFETLFAELNNEEQYIITEHVLIGRTFKDISNELCKPLFTIASIYRRGIMKIKRRVL